MPAASVAAIPDGATQAQASTLPMNGLTAMGGLEMLGLHDGDTLAVAGGAGLLGSYVIGVASMRGIRMIAEAKPEDEELASTRAGYAAAACSTRFATASGCDT